MELRLTEMKNLKLNIDTNLSEALLWGKAALNFAGIHPADREARWLLEFVLGNNKLITEPDLVLTENQRKKYEELISKRMEKYPLQYLIGEVEFVDAIIEVTPDVLIPRPETELLVEYVLEIIKDKNCDLKCADLGTGSGCIPIAVAMETRNSKFEIRNKSQNSNNKLQINQIPLTPFSRWNNRDKIQGGMPKNSLIQYPKLEKVKMILFFYIYFQY